MMLDATAVPFVYLAAPAEHPDPDVSRYRHQAVQSAASYLTRLGQAVYSPHLIGRAWASQHIADPGEAAFTAARNAIMRRCDRLAYLQLPGWKTCPSLAADLALASELELTPQAIPCTEPRVPQRWMPMLLPGAIAAAREQEIAPGIVRITTRTYQAVVRTQHGDLVFDLLKDEAPLAVANFVYLARDQGFYEDNQFHLVVPDTMLQAGCPKGDGTGDPGYALPTPQSVSQPYVRGTLAMYTAGEYTSGCQWFVVTGEQIALPPRYTIFGKLCKGDDVLTTLSRAKSGGRSNPYQPADRLAIANVDIVEADRVEHAQRLEPPPEPPASGNSKPAKRNNRAGRS